MTAKKIPTRRQIIARLKARGHNDDYIKSYLRGWDSVGERLRSRRVAEKSQ